MYVEDPLVIGMHLPNSNGLIVDLVAEEVKREFILTLARALLLFGAPSHRIEAQLTAAAKHLNIDARESFEPFAGPQFCD